MKHKSELSHGCGVRKVDSLTHMLFMLVTQLVAETLVEEFKKHNVTLIDEKVSTKSDYVIRKHKT